MRRLLQNCDDLCVLACFGMFEGSASLPISDRLVRAELLSIRPMRLSRAGVRRTASRIAGTAGYRRRVSPPISSGRS